MIPRSLRDRKSVPACDTAALALILHGLATHTSWGRQSYLEMSRM